MLSDDLSVAKSVAFLNIGQPFVDPGDEIERLYYLLEGCVVGQSIDEIHSLGLRSR